MNTILLLFVSNAFFLRPTWKSAFFECGQRSEIDFLIDWLSDRYGILKFLTAGKQTSKKYEEKKRRGGTIESIYDEKAFD